MAAPRRVAPGPAALDLEPGPNRARAPGVPPTLAAGGEPRPAAVLSRAGRALAPWSQRRHGQFLDGQLADGRLLDVVEVHVVEVHGLELGLLEVGRLRGDE